MSWHIGSYVDLRETFPGDAGVKLYRVDASPYDWDHPHYYWCCDRDGACSKYLKDTDTAATSMADHVNTFHTKEFYDGTKDA